MRSVGWYAPLLFLAVVSLSGGLDDPALAASSSCDDQLARLAADAVPVEAYVAAVACGAGRHTVDQLFHDKQHGSGTVPQHLYRISEAAAKACHVTTQAESHLYVAIGRTEECLKAQPTDVFGSNHVLNYLFIHSNISGHREITVDAFSKYCADVAHGCSKLSSSAKSILGDAAEDPDYYEWKRPEAHAQTPMTDDVGSVVSAPSGDFEGAFRAWVIEQLRRSKSYCHANDYPGALYYLGYAMHAVQDLAAHRGRTNAEHKYDEDYPKEPLTECVPAGSECATRQVEACGNPDADVCNIPTGTQLTLAAIKDAHAYLDGGGDQCFERIFAAYADGTSLRGSVDKGRLHLGKGWDFDLEQVQIYEGLGKTMKKLTIDQRRQQVRRWFAEKRWKDVATRLSNAILAAKP